VSLGIGGYGWNGHLAPAGAVRDDPPMSDPDRAFELVAGVSELIGVWADRVVLTYGDGGCTLDFLREDSLIDNRAILVGRVTLSAQETHRLMRTIDAAITTYAQASFEE
jgi:hypothetical protein